MCRSRRLAALAASTLVLLLGVAAPAAAQLPDLPAISDELDGLLDIPGFEELAGVVDLNGLLEELALDELVTIPGLDLADPLLDEVRGIVEGLDDLVDPGLANAPSANALQLGGADAIEAAIAFSQLTYEQTDIVLLGRAGLFADSLSSSAIQGAYDAPLLLTQTDRLDPRTLAEIERLGAYAVGILGSDAAVSPAIAEQLAAAGYVIGRFAGASRIETAVSAAQLLFPDATHAVLLRAYPSSDADDSQAYADALAVGPWAAENSWPILLTQSEVLTPSVADYLAASAISSITIVGGDGAVSAAVQDALANLGIAVTRVAGDNRFATAAEIARARGFEHSGQPARVILSEAGSHPDAWAPGFTAAAQGALEGAPIVLAQGSSLPPETVEFLTAGLADNLTDGGPALVCASFVDATACDAAARLLLGDLDDATRLIGADLGDLADLEELLGVLDDAGLLSPQVSALVDQLVTLLEQLLQGDVAAVIVSLDRLIEGLVDDLLAGAGGLLDDGEGGALEALLGSEGLLGGVLADGGANPGAALDAILADDAAIGELVGAGGLLGGLLNPVVGGGGNPDGGDPGAGDPDGGDPDAGDPDAGDPDGGDPDDGAVCNLLPILC